jgi:hypothetical protein
MLIADAVLLCTQRHIFKRIFHYLIPLMGASLTMDMCRSKHVGGVP